MTERHLRCRDVVELLNAYVDGTLTSAEREEIERHLGTCQGCVAFLAQLRLAVETTASLSEEDVPPTVMHTLLDAFRSAT